MSDERITGRRSRRPAQEAGLVLNALYYGGVGLVTLALALFGLVSVVQQAQQQAARGRYVADCQSQTGQSNDACVDASATVVDRYTKGYGLTKSSWLTVQIASGRRYTAHIDDAHSDVIDAAHRGAQVYVRIWRGHLEAVSIGGQTALARDNPTLDTGQTAVSIMSFGMSIVFGIVFLVIPRFKASWRSAQSKGPIVGMLVSGIVLSVIRLILSSPSHF